MPKRAEIIIFFLYSFIWWKRLKVFSEFFWTDKNVLMVRHCAWKGLVGNILDNIEAKHVSFIEMLVYVLTEFVTSFNASHISHIKTFCKVEVRGCGDIEHIY